MRIDTKHKMQDETNKQVYLYQSGSKIIEVVLTGRTAKKRKGRREVVLYEITSADKDVGFSTWIKLDQLFTIDE